MKMLANTYGAITLKDSAFKQKCCIYTMKSYKNEISLGNFLNGFEKLILGLANKEIESNKTVIAHLRMAIRMKDIDYGDSAATKEDIFYFSTKLMPIYDFASWFHNANNLLNEQIENFLDKGSGWKIDGIEYGELRYITL